jgi:DNA-binding cell septation regulator SpoVG
MAMQYKVVEPDCGLKITKVTISAVSGGMYTKAKVTVELNHALVLRDLSVMESPMYGFFVGYPIDNDAKCEEVRELVTTIDDQLRDYIKAVVLNKYSEMTEASQPVWIQALEG